MAGDQRRKRVVVGVEGRQVGAERDPRGAGQRGEVEHQLRRVLVRKRKRVGKDHPPFGVGVADFDRDPLAADDHVARAHRRRRDRILDDRDQRPQAEIKPRLHDHPRQRQRRRRSAHVLFHELHAGRRLDVEAAGVEGDPFADERHFWRVLASPGKVDEPRLFSARASDRMDEGKIGADEFGAAHHGDAGVEMLGKLDGLLFKCVRDRVHWRAR